MIVNAIVVNENFKNEKVQRKRRETFKFVFTFDKLVEYREEITYNTENSQDGNLAERQVLICRRRVCLFTGVSSNESTKFKLISLPSKSRTFFWPSLIRKFPGGA